MNTTSANTISSADDFEPTPVGQAELWSSEMEAADREVQKWQKSAARIVDRFLDKRGTNKSDQTRLNLFTSNIQTLRSMMYGQVPAVDCKRRHDDYADDAGRVAGTILERMLNNDMERADDAYNDVLRYVLDDRLIVGLGCARVRYEVETEEVEVPAQMGHVMPDGRPMPGPMEGMPEVELAPAYTEEKKVWEDAPVDYVHWRDVLWSPARVWGEVRWIAFRSYLTKDEMAERFGDKIAKGVPYNTTKKATDSMIDALQFDAWKRCEVWEIWDKDNSLVNWWVKGYDKMLDTKDDPLQLEGFFPCPRFWIANLTTSAVMPRPDFDLHRDLYNEIDAVSTRIERLERAVRAVGVYDKSAVGVQRMMEEATDNELIPVDNWAMFAEKGGIQGTVQWMPLQDIVGAITQLNSYRDDMIDKLFQVSGMSDIMRGASTMPNVTATEQGLKARFASVRVNALQDQFADFASALQSLRAEVIVNHFDDETILVRSGIMQTPDAPLVPQALQLLRSQFAEYHVEIMPDSIARADYAALKNDRVEFITAIGQFISQALPLATQTPAAAPALIEMVKWAATGFRGGAQMETVMDQVLDQMVQQKPGGEEEKPDPAMALQEAKAQSEQARQQGRMMEVQVKSQGRMQELQAKQQAEMQMLMAEHQSKMAEIQAELQADIERERTQSVYNIQEERAKVDVQTQGRVIQGGFGP